MTSSSRLAIEVSSTTSRSASISSLRRALAGNPAERGVDRRRVHPGRLGHPAGGAAGRRDERDRRALRLRRGADQPDRRRLAGARAAGDDREPRAERRLDRRPLLGRGDEVVAPASGSGGFERRRAARARRWIVAASSASSAGDRRPVGPDDAVVDLEHELVGVAHLAAAARPSGAGPPSSAPRSRQLGDRQARRAVALGLAQARGSPPRACARPSRAGCRPRARSCPRSGTRPRTRSSARTGACARPRARGRRTPAAIRGTSHASPCGASSRCSARVERSPFQERIASLTRFGFSPAIRNAAAGIVRRSRPARRRRSAPAAAPPARRRCAGRASDTRSAPARPTARPARPCAP